MTPFTLNLRGRAVNFTRPVVMGIINVTPDSFYASSRTSDRAAIESRAARMAAEGADMIDIGACSARPGSESVDEREELQRLALGLEAVRRVAPDLPVSVDTFRARVAARAIEMGADIINDISGGSLDRSMFDTVARLGVPYVLMHMRGTPATMQSLTDYTSVTAGVMSELAVALARLEALGVCDVIVDPGFGFSKTLAQNYELLHDLSTLRLLHRPLLVGVSRKSMATRLLGIEPADALNATTALHIEALSRGADILRVHDVRAAAEAVAIHCACTDPSSLQTS